MAVFLAMSIVLSFSSGTVLNSAIVGQELPNLFTLMGELVNITDYQFEARVGNLQGTTVTGSGFVQEVGSVGLFDMRYGPSGYSYKVIVHLNGNDERKAVVYLRSSTGLASLNVGTPVYFTGTILGIVDWGFWHEAYIRGNQLSASSSLNASVTRSSTGSWIQGHENYSIRWSGFAGSLSLYLIMPSGATETIGTFPSQSGSAQVSITPSIGVGSGYYIKAVDSFGNSATSSSFSIQPFSITSPASGSTWARGHISPLIQWSDRSSPEVKLVLMQGSRQIQELTNGWVLNQGSLSPQIDVLETWSGEEDYFVRVSVRTIDGYVWSRDSERVRLPFSDNERQGAARLSTETSSSGIVDYSEDVDYWRVTCLPKHTYEFALETSSSICMDIYKDSQLLSAHVGNTACWDSELGGVYYLKLTGTPGQEGSYTISPTVTQFPEVLRPFRVSAEVTALLSNGFTNASTGVAGGLSYSPIRFVELGASAYVLPGQEAMQSISDPELKEDFTFLGFSAGLQSPELMGLSVRAGATYDFLVSAPQFYWLKPEYEDLEGAFVSGIRPYISLDWKAFSQRYGNALFVRLQRSFISPEAGRMSLGIVYAIDNP